MKAMIGCTIKEAIRKKTFIVMAIITLLYLIFWGVILFFFIREMDARGAMIKDIASHLVTTVGMNFSSMLVALLTIMLAAGAVSADLETGVIHAVLSRPIGRWQYILGKFTGYALISCAYATALYVTILGLAAALGLPLVRALELGPLLGGWMFFLLEPIALLCLTIFGSVIMRTVPNGILMIFIFVLGNIGGMVEQVGNIIDNQNVTGAGIFLSLVSPFHTLYNSSIGELLPSAGLVGDLAAISGGMAGGGASASAWMYVYIGVYMCGFLLLAARTFGKKDIA